MKKNTDTKKLFSNLSAFGHQNKFKSCFLSCCLTENEKEFLLKYVKKWGKKYDSTQFTFVCDWKQETMPSPCSSSTLHKLWSHSQSTSSPIQKVQGPSTKTSIKREGGILTSELLAPSSLKGVNFSALFLHSHKEKGQLPRGAGGLCPSYAL